MIDRLIEFSLKNKFIVVMLWIGIAVWGLWAMLRAPIDAIPDLSDNQVIVFTDWQGRSPQEVEDQITYPLTTNLQGLPGVKVVRSSSAFGFSMIFVIFNDDVDLYFARTRVLERLNLLPRRFLRALFRHLGQMQQVWATSSGTRWRVEGTACATCARCRTGMFATN